jgi:D-glycero-beta-D-manno-heptose-7-phosphate kinase
MGLWRRVEPEKVHKDLLALTRALPGARVGVIGDVAADMYVSGQTDRVSREAPVIIVRYEKQWVRPGCAANVACNVASLGAQVHLVSLVGPDEPGHGLMDLMRDAHVDTSGVLVMPDMHTSCKTRFLAGAKSTTRQQVFRLDRVTEGYPSKGAQSLLLERLDQLSDVVDVWIASDYGAGLIDDAVLEKLRQISKRKIVLADSRYHLTRYCGITAIKPNQEEALASVGLEKDDGLDTMADVAHRLRRQVQTRAVLVTLGNKGMMLAEGEGEASYIPAAGSDQIVDLTGAGDTAVAVLAAGLSAGGSFLQSACLANAAGGVVVMRHGAATASLDDITGMLEKWAGAPI